MIDNSFSADGSTVGHQSIDSASTNQQQQQQQQQPFIPSEMLRSTMTAPGSITVSLGQATMAAITSHCLSDLSTPVWGILYGTITKGDHNESLAINDDDDQPIAHIHVESFEPGMRDLSGIIQHRLIPTQSTISCPYLSHHQNNKKPTNDPSNAQSVMGIMDQSVMASNAQPDFSVPLDTQSDHSSNTQSAKSSSPPRSVIGFYHSDLIHSDNHPIHSLSDTFSSCITSILNQTINKQFVNKQSCNNALILSVHVNNLIGSSLSTSSSASMLSQ